MRILLLLILTSCWRGTADPAPQPAPRHSGVVPVHEFAKDPPRTQTHPAPAVRSTAPGASAGSPGPLAIVHQVWDDQTGCIECHDTPRTVAAAKCVGCHDHDMFRARLAKGAGLHANALMRGKPCEACHHEHKGRFYDLMGWKSLGRPAFDHALTGWPLPPPYRATRCTMCHVAIDQQGLQLYLGADRARYP